MMFMEETGIDNIYSEYAFESFHIFQFIFIFNCFSFVLVSLGEQNIKTKH